MTLGDPPVTAPIPIQTGRPSWREIVALFRVRNFRLSLISIFSSSIATWMSRIAVDWLLLELTGNLALVGLAVSLQFGPTLFFGVLAGVVADRFPRRRIVLTTQGVAALGAACLALLAILGAVEVWQVYLVAFVTGLAGALEWPARSALLGQIVEPARMRTAVSINAGVFHVGGLIGPAVSGVLIAIVGWGGRSRPASSRRWPASSRLRSSALTSCRRSRDRRPGAVGFASRCSTPDESRGSAGRSPCLPSSRRSG